MMLFWHCKSTSYHLVSGSGHLVALLGCQHNRHLRCMKAPSPHLLDTIGYFFVNRGGSEFPFVLMPGRRLERNTLLTGTNFSNTDRISHTFQIPGSQIPDKVKKRLAKE